MRSNVSIRSWSARPPIPTSKRPADKKAGLLFEVVGALCSAKLPPKKSAARWPHYRESSKLVLVIHPSAVHTNAVAEVPGPRTSIAKTAVTYLRTPVLSVVFIAVVVFLLSMIGPVPQTDLSPAISPIRSVSSVLFALCRYRITACRQ